MLARLHEFKAEVDLDSRGQAWPGHFSRKFMEDAVLDSIPSAPLASETGVCSVVTNSTSGTCLQARPGAVLACDECYPRMARATWTFQGTDATGTPWRAAVCERHLPLIDEELAERGGYGSLEPLGAPRPRSQEGSAGNP
jgi:hypothetical protein